MIIANTVKVTTSQATGFAMPASVRERAATVHAIPTGAVTAAAAGMCTAATDIQGTRVSGYRLIGDVVADRKGAFPGPSAWSPPI
jgi:zona occludens toxin (predicted ATPase)